jgi:hypothetical protein
MRQMKLDDLADPYFKHAEDDAALVGWLTARNPKASILSNVAIRELASHVTAGCALLEQGTALPAPDTRIRVIGGLSTDAG